MRFENEQKQNDKQLNLMMALIKYHVLDIKNNEEINNLIISELEEKLSKMSRHEDYTKSKMAPTKEEREEYRQKYLEAVGMHWDFRW